MTYILPEELQERRYLSMLYHEYDDINLPVTNLYYVKDSELVDYIINFFLSESTLTYPPKAYFVALVYAACVQKYFPNYFLDITDVLRCSDLLINDKYFVPYNKHSWNIYNSVLRWFEKERREILSFPSTDKTHDYFKEEFLIC